MTYSIANMLCFSVNLTLIVTNLYGWLLKRFFVPKPFKENSDELYPARLPVATFCLFQLFELPYLLHIGHQEALFYVNGTGLLFFSSYLLVLIKTYFYYDYFKPRRLVVFMLPVVVCWVVLLLPIVGIIPFTETFRWVMFAVVILFCGIYLCFLVHFRNRLHRKIRELDENEYSNESDFPLSAAKRLEWLPLGICLLMLVNFVLDDPNAKFVRDLIFIVINVWFVIYSLNPHRSVRPELKDAMQDDETPVATSPKSKHRLTEEQCKDMETRLLELLDKEQLFLEDHLTMSDLTQRMHTNKNYLGEVIARSEYGSFYNLVNTLRIEHACRLLAADPSAKLEQIAFASGFGSGSAFSQVFKRLKGVSPSEYCNTISYSASSKSSKSSGE